MSLPRDPSRNLNSTPPTARSDGQALPLFDAGPTLDDPKDSPVAIHQEPSAGLIGTYRLLEKLGEGGMGQVWLAEQTSPVKRQVALKLIRNGIYEGRWSAVSNPNNSPRDHGPSAVSRKFRGRVDAQRPALLRNGVCTRSADYSSIATRRSSGFGNVWSFLCVVCDGVQHAHQKAIIHRDFKPSNILVVELDGQPCAAHY